MSLTRNRRAAVRGVVIAAVAGLLGSGWAAAPVSLPAGREASSPFMLTFLGNMGVLVTSGGTKVLIDALFDKPNPDYRAPTAESLDKIMKGEAPFDGVDLVLVTHDHPDHFDAGLAVRFLEAEGGPVLVAPEDAVEAMRRAAADWPRIASRVVPVGLKVGEKRSLDVRGILVTACRTLHSGDRDSPMNLMYLLELEGRRVFHEGDPNGRCDIFQAFGLSEARLDLAVVHYWYPLDPNCARFFQETLKVDHIALAHLPIKLEGDAPGKIAQVRSYYKDLFLLLPEMPDTVLQEASSAGSQKITDLGIGHPVLFYSGRTSNKDVYVLYPGESEPRNLTNHPAWDGWACYLPAPSHEAAAERRTTARGAAAVDRPPRADLVGHGPTV